MIDFVIDTCVIIPQKKWSDDPELIARYSKRNTTEHKYGAITIGKEDIMSWRPTADYCGKRVPPNIITSEIYE